MSEANGGAVEVAEITRSFGDRKALDGVSFTVGRGEAFGLLGPNGGGKTTLFRILSTALLPTSGSARILGIDVARDPGAIRRRLGVLFQSPSLDSKLTVEENLRHRAWLYGLRGPALEELIAQTLDRLGIRDRAGDRAEKLSGGLKRRAEIGATMLSGPEVLLLDEPGTGLDPLARLGVWETLARLREERGVTVLLTTHFMEEAERCDRIGILHRGKLAAIGRPDDLKAEVGEKVLRVKAKDPASLKARLKERYSIEPSVSDGHVCLDRGVDARWVAEIAADFRDEIESVTLARPTLEDVFFRRTGDRLDGPG